MPRYIFEVLSMVVLGVIYFVSIIQGKAYFDIFLLLGLYAAATVRLVPAINNITASLSQMRNSFYALTRVISGLSSSSFSNHLDTHDRDRSYAHELGGNSISFNNVSFSYLGKKEKVFDSVSMDLNGPGLIALIGESGSGKSTAFDLMLGFRSPDQGEIIVGGLSSQSEERALYDLISYSPQEGVLFQGSVVDNILLGREFDAKSFDDAVKLSCLSNLIGELPSGIESVLSEDGLNFSGGQRQRIRLARAIYSARPILLLDEPTSALDGENTSTLMSNLKVLSESRLIVVCTHDRDVMLGCDRIIQLKNKQLTEVA
jgi:ABC-type bacteriocin/lantibiotic exporter with double-glycine peptidase domain